ncbi:MAG: thioesterase [Deltaproteobacteria bacterium]|nr:thioesterase [Deltaproteobacteria bacterium]
MGEHTRNPRLLPDSSFGRTIGTSSPPGQTKFNAWITCPFPKPTAQVRLFCLPFAGGAASIYRTWGPALPQMVEVCPIQLPGRENRLSEPLYTNVGVLAERLAHEILAYAEKPFALFGHSMGALLAFELTRALRRHDGPLPRALFLSAHRAAHLPLRRQPLSGLPDGEFIRAVRRLGGTPDGVFEHPELRKLALPVLRADFTMCDRYSFVPESPLNCPLILYAGRQDIEVLPQEVEVWREHTTGVARLHLFPGDHFFLRSDRDVLLRSIASVLA